MKKLDIFTKIFFAVSVTFNTLVISQAKSEDLRYQYNSQESASWGNAQYENITTNVRGERLIIRFFVDKNSNIYEFKRTPNYNYGPTKLGNLNSKSYSTGDTCYFGTNAECLSNITKTTKQYVIEGCQLIKYTRTDMIQFGTKGDINRYVLGSCINSAKKKYFEKIGKLSSDGKLESNLESHSFVFDNSYLEKDCSAYVVIEGETWDKAEQNAQKIGGHLVSINTSEENDFLTKNINWNTPIDENQGAYGYAKKTHGKGQMAYWIGINDADKEGELRWSDGSPVDYMKNKPSDGRGNEDWGTLVNNGEWNDIDQTGRDGGTKHWQMKMGIAEIDICQT